MQKMPIAELLAEARPRLRSAVFEISAREAPLLLGHLLGWSEAQVRARSDRTVEADVATHYFRLIERRLSGEPVAYLLGQREFYGRDFFVDERVLIPRPETEHIVEVALELTLPSRPKILDIGTGSGCLAITLAAEIPQSRVVAADLSPAALAVMDRNRRRHGSTDQLSDRVLAVGSDLTTSLRLGAFDLVVSNPPYVDRQELPTMSLEVKDYEPHMALFAPGHGGSVIERLLDATHAMRPGAYLLMEIGYDQGEWLTEATTTRSHLDLIELRKDLSGIPRTGVLRRNDSAS